MDLKECKRDMWATSTCGEQYNFQRLCLLYNKILIKLQIKLFRFYVEETNKYSIKRAPSDKWDTGIANKVITPV